MLPSLIDQYSAKVLAYVVQLIDFVVRYTERLYKLNFASSLLGQLYTSQFLFLFSLTIKSCPSKLPTCTAFQEFIGLSRSILSGQKIKTKY